MTSLVRTSTRWACAVVLASTLVACGSSGSKSAATTTSKAKSTTSTTAATTTTPDTSSTSGANATGSTTSPATTETTPSTVVAKGGGAFCKKIADSYNSALNESSGALSTPAGLKKQLELSQKNSHDALAIAPGEIKGDLGVIFGASDTVINALKKANYDVSKVSQSALTSISSPAVKAAGDRVTAFVKKQCGIDLGSSSSSSGSGPATTVP